jgi:23S rRNA (guanine745-N1)-methyltransferase
MVRARAAFLATGAYHSLSDQLNEVCRSELAKRRGPGAVLDAGCGEGYYTRRLAAALELPVPVAGVDVARPAIAAAAARHRDGRYAVASVFGMPVPPASMDLLLSVFGPVASEEFARVLRTSAVVVAVHPGPCHLFALRELVYERPEPHQVKDPLRDAHELFSRTGTLTVGYPLTVPTADAARQLLAMTPYRWHAPRDIDERLVAAGGLETEVDVVISTYQRR